MLKDDSLFWSWRIVVLKRAENIRRWVEGKPMLLGMVAVQSASMCNVLEDFYGMLESEKVERALPPLPPVGEWAAMFRDHRQVGDAVGSLVNPIGAPGGLMESFDELRAFIRLSPKKRKRALKEIPPQLLENEIREGVRAGREMLEGVLEDVELDIAGNVDLGSKAEERRVFKWIGLPGTQFMIRVVFRSWINYGEDPWRLFRLARSGTQAQAMVAIGKLLKLDSGILMEPRIVERLRQAKRRRQGAVLEDLGAALANTAPIERRKRLKIIMAALIWKMAEGMRPMSRVSVSVPEIRRLFDAVATDYGRGLRDDDLPVSDEAFYKAVKRYVRFWAILPEPDKKVRENVRVRRR